MQRAILQIIYYATCNITNVQAIDEERLQNIFQS